VPDLVPEDAPEREIWFPAKTYGWGWGFPVHWKGWVFFIAWIAFYIYGVLDFVSRAEMTRFWIFNIAMIVILIGVCWKKGEKPRWRWGHEDR
jgi:hypothetical protein